MSSPVAIPNLKSHPSLGQFVVISTAINADVEYQGCITRGQESNKWRWTFENRKICIKNPKSNQENFTKISTMETKLFHQLSTALKYTPHRHFLRALFIFSHRQDIVPLQNLYLLVVFSCWSKGTSIISLWAFVPPNFNYCLLLIFQTILCLFIITMIYKDCFCSTTTKTLNTHTHTQDIQSLWVW